ncbi:O-Antigen ligase [Corynebacterium occultum]|uniref:O-Antigen ligase n=1 Tax=Corynebacterium occultum TaxID=2675219 RepID=A0A6B8W4N3_9CORY|nr:O-antigen ligase family protein [Corynebacterium occultum]QGU08524.1 O-Antigen ligase [Corynebacterium occultum]
MIAVLATLALCLLTFLLGVRRPQWGLLTIATLVPFDGVLYIAPMLLEPWKELAVLTVALAACIAPRSRDRVTLVPWLPLAGVLVLYGSLSGVLVLGIAAAFPIKIAYFYLIPVLICCFFPFTRRDKDLLISLLLGTGLVTALFGLWQQVVGGWALADLGYEWNEHIRTTGPLLRSFSTFNQPFPFAFFMMLVLVMGVAVALAEPDRWRSRIFWLVSPILLVGMASSVVRAALIGLLAALLVLGVVMYRWILQLLAGFLGLVVLVLPLAFLADQEGRLAAMFSATSLLDRGGHWTQTLPQMLVHPFGMGLGTTGSSAERVTELSGSLQGVYQPDNQYLKIGLELGLPGLVLYALVIGIAMMVLHRLIRIQQDPLERAFTIGTLAMLVAALGSAIFATYLEIFPLDFYFWLLPAAAAGVSRTAAPQVGGWIPRRRQAQPA